MPPVRDDITITEFAVDDYPVVNVLRQRGDLWMRPSAAAGGALTPAAAAA
jgi:hypothetical protein